MARTCVNEGLEQNIHKYGQVFSGVQFLLGPDRAHKLSQEVLFLRWGVVQIGVVVVTACGIRIGRLALVGCERAGDAQGAGAGTLSG